MDFARLFLQTLSPDREPRKAAEELLRKASDQPGYGIAVLQLVADAGVDEQARQAAAVSFKNHVKFQWSPLDDSVTGIPDAEKDQIKSLMVRLMLSAPPKIQAQLGEALAIISSFDFPSKWQTLLPELVVTIQGSAGDYGTINGMLHTINTIFKIFRYKCKSQELYIDLKYCLDGFAPTLLEVFLRTGHMIRANQDPMVLRPMFVCQRLCCRIFYSLNSQELPEFFENNMQQWMDEFHWYLGYSNPALGQSDVSSGGPSIVDALKSAICDNINLYVEKNEEEFRDYLKRFALDVWQLMGTISLQPVHDQLAMSAMKFLTTVSRGVHHGLFKEGDTLKQIVEGIVIPNVRIREEDEELFEMNPIEYIRKDIEGSDMDTRRRMASELVKGLFVHFRAEMVPLISGYMSAMLGKYSANPAENWRDKDCAIYLVVSLAHKQAVTGTVETDLVNVEQFFMGQVLPELQSEAEVNSAPLLKADALKFITTFRSGISKPLAIALLPLVARFLLAESNVVHSYAASCVERMLIVRDGRQLRIGPSDLGPPVQDALLRNLFGTLKLQDSHENPYVMKAIMRVVSMVTPGPNSVDYLRELAGVLWNVCKNPTNPTFNHYMFEAVAALVKTAPQELLPPFEELLFPIFQVILGQNITEFHQYAFQLLALLIESRVPPIPDVYLQLFPILLQESLWQRSANVPAIVRLLQAFLLKAPAQVAQGNHLQQILGFFARLVAKKSSEDQGFYIGNTMVESLTPELLTPCVPLLWTALLNRLVQGNLRTLKFLKSFVVFMSLFVVKHGHAAVVDSLNVVSPAQPTLFTTVLTTFWIPTVNSIAGAIETKLCAVAATKLLCESRVVLDSDELWGKLLNSTVSLLIRPDEEKEDDGAEDVPDMEAISGHAGAFAQLHNAGRREADPLTEVRDAKEFLATSLSRLSAQQPGRFPIVIQTYLEATNQEGLLRMCGAYSAGIV